MTKAERVKFEEMAKRFGWSREVIEEVESFISDVSCEAYRRGSDAESYSNAVSRGD